MRNRANALSKSRLQKGSVGVNILIFLACCLCGLVGYQWFRDAALRRQIDDLNHQIAGLIEQKQTVESAQKRVEGELKRVEDLRTRLQDENKTNKIELAQISRELSVEKLAHERAEKQSDAYKDAFEKQKAQALRSNEIVNKANQELKDAAAARADLIAKYDELRKQYEDLGSKYTTAVDYIKKLQEAAGIGEKDKDKK
jgi:chromosome segregation ATPase